MTFTLGPALLFCPADRPDRYASALSRADAAILDLEDAVAPHHKAAARGALIDAHVDPARVIVRVNAVDSADFDADMATLSHTDFRLIMVPKAESAKKIARIDRRFDVIALCETPRGVTTAEKIADAANVVALMWGAEDLVAAIGGTSSRKAPKPGRVAGAYRDVARYARSRVLLAAAAAGKGAIDAVHVDIADDKGLRREARDAAASGFAASACIHPGQVEAIRAAYRPDEAALRWARGVLDAAAEERGVFRFEGRMVDEPVLRHARALLSRGAR
ncbi:HpcH/HpaI aldolase/citrate lyase family protein [Microbacterium flavum]|uniref:CoA ester lyase n=1 Tax=Microbacterium flavum TaxID=415216 RepID=A0ABS5XVI1_9MICO|nr:CoA ester lyase [Microbacterium flavum]MBT8798545.1 CoA ester lyase [Microbacterium flavum]